MGPASSPERDQTDPNPMQTERGKTVSTVESHYTHGRLTRAIADGLAALGRTPAPSPSTTWARWTSFTSADGRRPTS